MAKKNKKECPLCEGEGCFDSCGEGFYIICNKLYASSEGGCCGIEPIIIKYCPLCGKRLNKETDNGNK